MLSKDEISAIVDRLLDPTETDTEQLGEGGFGSVHRLGPYVIKMVELYSPIDVKDFKKEVDIWEEFSSSEEIRPFIPEYYGFMIDGEDFGYIVQKYEKVAELWDIIQDMHNRKTRLDFNLGYGIFQNIIKGFELIHKHGYVHRDIKALNILIRVGPNTSPLMPLIIDFGLVCKLPCEVEHAMCSDDPNDAPEGTTYYLANDLLPVKNRTKKRLFPVIRDRNTMLDKVKKLVGCSPRKKAVNKSVFVKTQTRKAKGFYNVASDRYALALTLADFVEVINWSGHLAEERLAEKTIISYQREILPLIAANIGSKISKTRATRKTKNKSD